MLQSGSQDLNVTGRIEADGDTLAVLIDGYNDKMDRIG